MRDIRELKYLQFLPLERKIEMTAERIDAWYQHYDGNVAVSFSGGKDSRVLLDIARKHWRGHKDIKAVFVDTGLEYSEIRKFVKTFDNVEIIKPKMRFDEVIKKYGYPVISKEVAQKIYEYRKKPDGYTAEKFFDTDSPYSMSKWIPLRDLIAIPISNRCCQVMKKAPAHNYAKKNGIYFMTAEMASESRLRQQNWLHHGCNGFDMKIPKSTPMAFWTEQDVLKYIYDYQLDICSIYGDVVCEPEQLDFEGNWITTYHTTGVDRSGCVFCGFGAHLEKDKKRFLHLKEVEPKKYDYCLNGGEFVNGIWQNNKQGLGMRYVFDELNKLYGDDFIRYE